MATRSTLVSSPSRASRLAVRRSRRSGVWAVPPQTASLDAGGTANIQVDVMPPADTPDGTTVRVTLVASVRGQPDLANSATVDLVVRTNAAPLCGDARPSVTEIWPPNGRLV